MAAIALRPYQEAGVADIRAAFKRKQYPVLFVLPTGAGKTVTFSYIAASAAEKGNSVLIIVHRKELLLQSSATLKAMGIDHGLISPHFTPAPHKRVQVASVDTLLIRLKKYMALCEAAKAAGREPPKNPYDFKLAIFDEGHHVTKTNKWGMVYELLGCPIALLTTATPYRGDGCGLGEGHGGIAKVMIIGPQQTELIEMGMLVKPTIYTCLSPPDFSDLKTNKEGEYNAKDVEERVDKPMIIGNAVDHYAEICPGARAIVFCASIKHAKHVVAEFNARGFRFSLLVGEPEMSDAERTDVKRRLETGELDGACSVALVDEGFDLPALQVCIVLAPTASRSRFKQRAGRVMRPAPGKSSENTWYFDHVGDVGRNVDGVFKVKHGLPWNEIELSLEGRKKGKKKTAADDVKMMQCPQCYHVFEPAKSCPQCGHDMGPQARQIEQVEGRLQKVTEELTAAAAAKEQARRDQGQCREPGEMQSKLGYNKWREAHVLKARQEKQALIDGLKTDLAAWSAETGQSPALFGIFLSDIPKMKPAELKDLRARFDEHRRQHNTKEAVEVFRRQAQQELTI